MSQSQPPSSPGSRGSLPTQSSRALTTQGESAAVDQAGTPPSRRQSVMSRFPDPLPVEQQGGFTHLTSTLGDYVFSEEMLVLVEFLLVLAVGVVGFVSAYPAVYTAVKGIIATLHKNFGLF